jgi:hypothetical protein
MRFTTSQIDKFRRLEIGLQRLRNGPNFMAQTRGLAPFTLRELVLLAFYAGTH